MPYIVGSAIESGFSSNGIVDVSDATGGGLVAVDYNNIQVGNRTPDALKFINRLAVALAGGVRQIVVPLLVDFIQPNAPGAVDGKTTFSDTTVFSDASQLSQTPISSTVAAAAASNAGTVSLTLDANALPLVGGEWFGLVHPTRSFRAYCVTDVDSQTTDAAGNTTYIVGIRPTLREAIAVGSNVDWKRPRCLMRLQPGQSQQITLERFFWSTPSLKFIEAF